MPFPDSMKVDDLDRVRAGHDPADLVELRAMYGPSKAWRHYIDKWLPAHPWETTEKKAIRYSLATYRNDAAGIVDRVKAMLFSEQPQIAGGRAKTVARLNVNADRAGLPLHQFFADRLVDGLTCQDAWVWVELPSDPDGFDRSTATAADAERLGLTDAYLRQIDPRSVYDWREAVDGLSWVKFREEDFADDADNPWRKPMRRIRWTWIDRAEVVVYEWRQKRDDEPSPKIDEYVPLVQRVAHGRATHPVRHLRFPEGLWLLDRMREAILAALRSRNNLDFTLTVASAALLAVVARQHNASTSPIMGTGTYIGLYRDEDGADDVKFVEPSGQNTALIARRASEAVSEVYEVAQQSSNVSSATGSGGKYQSGAAKVEERAVIEAMLADYATRIKTFITDVLNAVGDAEGWRDEERDVRVSGLYGWHDMEFGQFLQASVLSVEAKALSPEFVRAIARKQISRSLAPGEALDKALAEVEEADDDILRALGGVTPDGQALAAASGVLGGSNRIPGDGDQDGIPNEG